MVIEGIEDMFGNLKGMEKKIKIAIMIKDRESTRNK